MRTQKTHLARLYQFGEPALQACNVFIACAACGYLHLRLTTWAFFLGNVFSCARAPNPSWTPDSKLRIKFRCPKGNAFARACQGPIRASILFWANHFLGRSNENLVCRYVLNHDWHDVESILGKYSNTITIPQGLQANTSPPTIP